MKAMNDTPALSDLEKVSRLLARLRSLGIRQAFSFPTTKKINYSADRFCPTKIDHISD